MGNMWGYIPFNELPVEAFEANYVWFFRHKGLYMCHAYDFNKEYRFWLTEENVHLTKGQARKLLKSNFPMAIIELRVIARSNACK